MSTQIANRRSVTALLVLTALLGLTACLILPAMARAAEPEPEPVLRTFGFWVLNDPVPDFLGEDSLAVIVLPDTTGPSAELSLSLLVDAAYKELTEWQPHPAKYVTMGDASFSGSFYWLIDDATPTPPPAGAHTFTGPRGVIDGLIESVDVVRIRICTSVNCGCSCNNGLYTIDNVSGTRTFVMVTAWFSK